MRSKIKFVALSDTHGRLPKVEDVPRGDIFVFCGDFTSNSETHTLLKEGTPSPSMRNFFRFVRKLKHRLKIIVCGNHDFLDSFSQEHIQKEFFEEDVIYLQNNSVVIDIPSVFPKKHCTKIKKLKIFGSPYNSLYLAFHCDDIEEKWKSIENDTNIIITHIPPRGICDLFGDSSMDETKKGKKKKKKKSLVGEKRYHWGCEKLRSRIDDLSTNVENKSLIVHFFGHVHHKRGIMRKNEVTFINASEKSMEYDLEI